MRLLPRPNRIRALLTGPRPKGPPAPARAETARAKTPARKRIAPAGAKSRVLNLALQGGGSHGAFTWGVLDRLLDEESLQFDGVSGTSAGAVNAVAFAAGLMEGGRAGAQDKLREVWQAIRDAAGPGWISSPARATLARLSESASPYHLNPLDMNPLRTVLQDRIDFEALRTKSPVKLYIAATEVATGRARIFETEQVSLEVVLASACLPTVFQAVRIGTKFYWDGGYSANPDLTTLIARTRADDTLLVLLNPLHAPDLPTKASAIADGVNRITFNQPLRREVELIERSRKLGKSARERAARRLAQTRFHLISAERYTSELDSKSKFAPDAHLLAHLHDAGHAEAGQWLENGRDCIGRRATADLYAEFFEKTYLMV